MVYNEEKQEWKMRGLPPIPVQFREEAEQTKQSNDDFGMWFENNLEAVEDARVSKYEILQNYKNESEVMEGMKRKGFKYDKELKGFAKVELQPGETKTASIRLNFRAFAFYNPRYRQWITEGGQFEILIGASSADIRQTLSVTLQSSVELPCILDRESSLVEWLEDPRGRQVLGGLYEEIEVGLGKYSGNTS